jgi:hypothetical protein
MGYTASYFFFSLQVVYAILHRQEVFEPFKNHPRFNELLENIYTVCVLFIFHEFGEVQKKNQSVYYSRL